MEPTYTGNALSTTALSDYINELKTQIAKLEVDVSLKDNYIESVDRRLTRASNQIDSFRQILIDCVKRNEIDPDLAYQFATCFDFDIRREFNFTGTLKFEGVVYLPLDFDPDDLSLDDYIEFYFNSHNNVDIELSTYDSFIDDMEEV